MTLYLERVFAELVAEDGRAPVAKRAFRVDDTQRIYAMYAAQSRDEMAFDACMRSHIYYLNADGVLYAQIGTGATLSLDLFGSGGNFYLRTGGEPAADLSPLVSSWRHALGTGDDVSLRTLDGPFADMVLLEKEVFPDSVSLSLEILGRRVPLMLEDNGDRGTVRALLTAEERDALLKDPRLLRENDAAPSAAEEVAGT